MVSNVGLNLGSSNYLMNSFSGTGVSANTNSVFGSNPLQPVNSDYENDLLMPDFLKTSSPSFSASIAQQAEQIEQQENIEQKEIAQTTQYGQQQIEQTQAKCEDAPGPFAKAGLGLGAISPVLISLIGKTPFNLKSMAIKIPLLGIFGYALGALTDGLISANKPKTSPNQPQSIQA